MNNNEMNIGSGNNFGGSTKFVNKTNIKKGHVVLSLTIVIVIVFIASMFLKNDSGNNIIGRWHSENGRVIEFLSDGTIHTGDGYDSLHADTYEIMDEGYLKWGKYDTAWISYRYTYWDIEINGNHLTLTSKDNPEHIIELTRE